LVEALVVDEQPAVGRTASAMTAAHAASTRARRGVDIVVGPSEESASSGRHALLAWLRSSSQPVSGERGRGGHPHVRRAASTDPSVSQHQCRNPTRRADG